MNANLLHQVTKETPLLNSPLILLFLLPYNRPTPEPPGNRPEGNQLDKGLVGRPITHGRPNPGWVVAILEKEVYLVMTQTPCHDLCVRAQPSPPYDVRAVG